MKSILEHTKKKAQLGRLAASLISLIVAIIILVLGVVVMQELRDTQTDTASPAYQAANDSTVAVGDFSDFVPIIVIALAASIVIGLILVGFAFRARSR